MSIREWFHDIHGKFSGEDGVAILEIYLLRRETALSQLKLLRERRKRGWHGQGPQSITEICKTYGKSRHRTA